VRNRNDNCFPRCVRIFRNFGAGVLLVTIALSGCSRNEHFADRVATPEWADFTENVQKYTNLVDGLESRIPTIGTNADPTEIANHKAALAKAIREERSNAKQGDIFTPSVREKFLNAIRSETRGPDGKAAKNTVLKDDNPATAGTPVTVAVNAVYSDKAPLSTMPPTLLLRLPTLPEHLDYRFVNKTLVLHDTRANLIVDYIPHAIL
jgi:hypothetical protein